MTATMSQARDEVYAKFAAAWAATELPILYPDTKAEPIPATGAWCRITVSHNTSRHATLGGETGNRRFRRFGIVTVQIFTEYGDGQVTADRLATIARDAFEGEVTSPGRVIFRNVRVVDVGQDGPWTQTNVLAEFEYDEIR